MSTSWEIPRLRFFIHPVLLNISSHIDRDGSGEPGSIKCNQTAINHIHWSLLFTAVERQHIQSTRGAENTNYKLY